MKKHNRMRKVLSAALMLVLLVSVASVTVSADWTPYPDEQKPYQGVESWLPLMEDLHFNDVWYYNSYLIGNDWIPHEKAYEGYTVHAADFDKYVQPWLQYGDGTVLELAGMDFCDSLEAVYNSKGEVVIPAFPKDGTPEEQNAWNDQYWGGYKAILLTYMFHEHDLSGSPFYMDDNYHWKLCTKCSNRVFLANHTDKNNDGKCDFCDNPIRYYNVAVKDAAGGKVTVAETKGAMGATIKVTVAPDAGYHLDALKFVNNNAVHSQLACYEDKAGAEYHFIVANWDVDVEAAFVKD